MNVKTAMKPRERVSRSSAARVLGAFTLLELMIVVAIIGILAAIGLPAMKGMGEGNRLEAAYRQVVDDLAFARLRAIADRTTVYMVFVPPETIWQHIGQVSDPTTRMQLTNLVSGQYTGYALMSQRTVGDQPGQNRPRYLTDWKFLPEGMVFTPYQYNRAPAGLTLGIYDRTFPRDEFPFPTAASREFELPYLAFNSQGQLTTQRDEVITFSRGSVFFEKDNAERFIATEPNLVLTPQPQPATGVNLNRVKISWLTGRTESLRP